MTGRGYAVRAAALRYAASPLLRVRGWLEGHGPTLIPSRSQRDRIEGRLAAGKPAAVQDALPRTVAMKLR